MSAGQSVGGSIIEAWTNVIVGFGLAFASQLIIFGAYGFNITLKQDLEMTILFTFISLVRSFVLRRAFNYFTTRKT